MKMPSPSFSTITLTKTRNNVGLIWLLCGTAHRSHMIQYHHKLHIVCDHPNMIQAILLHKTVN